MSDSLVFGSPSGKPMFSLRRKWRKFAGHYKVTDICMDNKQNRFFLTSFHFSVEVFLQVAQRLQVI